MRRESPDGAQRWLSELRDVDDAWREGILRR
jgi:hypothetical protein